MIRRLSSKYSFNGGGGSRSSHSQSRTSFQEEDDRGPLLLVGEDEDEGDQDQWSLARDESFSNNSYRLAAGGGPSGAAASGGGVKLLTEKTMVVGHIFGAATTAGCDKETEKAIDGGDCRRPVVREVVLDVPSPGLMIVGETTEQKPKKDDKNGFKATGVSSRKNGPSTTQFQAAQDHKLNKSITKSATFSTTTNTTKTPNPQTTTEKSPSESAVDCYYPSKKSFPTAGTLTTSTTARRTGGIMTLKTEGGTGGEGTGGARQRHLSWFGVKETIEAETVKEAQEPSASGGTKAKTAAEGSATSFLKPPPTRQRSLYYGSRKVSPTAGRFRPSVVIGLETNVEADFGVCGWLLTLLSYLLICITFPLSLCFCIKIVQEYERAVMFRLGRLLPGGARGPGIFLIVPCIDTYRKVDLRVVSFDVPPQEILSKDSVTVAVDAVVYFRISNATVSVTNVEDASRSTKLLAQTTLRNILGTRTLAEMLSDREAISHQMQSTLDEATDPWGVKVERVEVKDVRLPLQLQRAMAAEAEAAREARAKVIAAEGEQKASRALKEAADVIAESSSALQLRYLQTLNTISAEKNSTIVFPLPMDLISEFLPA